MWIQEGQSVARAIAFFYSCTVKDPPVTARTDPQSVLDCAGFAEVAGHAAFVRLVTLFRRASDAYYASGRGVPCELQWRDHRPHHFGEGGAVFTVTVNDKTGVAAIASL